MDIQIYRFISKVFKDIQGSGHLKIAYLYWSLIIQKVEGVQYKWGGLCELGFSPADLPRAGQGCSRRRTPTRSRPALPGRSPTAPSPCQGAWPGGLRGCCQRRIFPRRCARRRWRARELSCRFQRFRESQPVQPGCRPRWPKQKPTGCPKWSAPSSSLWGGSSPTPETRAGGFDWERRPGIKWGSWWWWRWYWRIPQWWWRRCWGRSGSLQGNRRQSRVGSSSRRRRRNSAHHTS